MTEVGDQIRQLLKKAKAKDFQAFARLLTVLERTGPQVLEVSELANPSSLALRVGLTGPPGAGKSTLTGQLITRLRAQGLTVGVIAVDPSSPFSHGAILGDRIRYTDHFSDPGVFIRSLGTRGSLGGLSASAYLMLRAFDICGFDVVLVETVGVGQTELEIMHVADLVSVILVPESGDAVQAMKAGLLEIAHIFVVNKSDRPGSGSLVRELESSILMGTAPGQPPQAEVLKTVATTGEGVDSLLERVLEAYRSRAFEEQRKDIGRLRHEAKALLRHEYEQQIEKRAFAIQSVKEFQNLFFES